MKLVTFSIHTQMGRQKRLGVLIDGHQYGRIADLTNSYAAYLENETDEPMPREIASLRTPPDMIGWLRGAHKAREAADQAVDYLKERLEHDPDPRGLDDCHLVYPHTEVRLLAPLPRPRSVRFFSVFEEHMTKSELEFEREGKPPEWYRWPPYYKGNPDSFIGPEDPVPFPYYTERLDLEIEIAIVIGREGRNLTLEQARECIAGYSILIDTSCRGEWKKWSKFGPTKSKDFNNVMGPCLVTADDIDEANLNVRVSVDGETWFEGNTGHRRSFLAHHLVAYLSDNETIYPGDVLSTGTIGFGCSMDLHRWIKVGQTAVFEVEGIGSLSCKVAEGEHIVDYTLNGMDGLLTPPSLKPPRAKRA
jgi:2-keto-4-pentenoate hydratase/2-oxohepta-3-ene-1,7-dioic acid hydratase in catechol pathway